MDIGENLVQIVSFTVKDGVSITCDDLCCEVGGHFIYCLGHCSLQLDTKIIGFRVTEPIEYGC